MSRPEGFHLKPLAGRVEGRRACCRWRVSSSALSIAEWVHNATVATFPAPRSNAACGFPALRFPARFTSGLWDLSGWELSASVVGAAPMELLASQALIEPLPPPLPAEAPPFPCTQMTPDFLFHQSLTKPQHRLASPTAKYRTQPRRIGFISATPARSAGIGTAKNFLQLPQKGCPLLEQRWIPRPPSASSAAHPPELKTQEATLLSRARATIRLSPH